MRRIEAEMRKCGNAEMSQESLEDGNVQLKKRQPCIENDGDDMPLVNHVKSDAKSKHSIDRDVAADIATKEPEAMRKNRPFSTVSIDGRPKSQEKGDISSRNVSSPLFDS